jgi:beta-glucosidase
VIGPNADEIKVLLGNYNGTPSKAVTPLEGIRQKISPSTKLYFAWGCDIADGVPPLKVIPTHCLRPLDAGADQTGLTAAYYDHPTLGGEPVLLRVDPVVDFSWKDAPPLGGKTGAFAARWTGYLVAPVTGKCKIGVQGFTDFNLYLDGELIAAHKGIHDSITKTKEVKLEAGRFYDLRLEYVNRGPAPAVQLLWALADRDYAAEAMEAASQAEVVIVVLGLSSTLEGEEMPVRIEGFEGGDRTDITLPRPQEELLRRIHALGKPMVLVLLNGSAVAVKWANDHVPAIVEAWYPGEEGGTAIADVLFGDYNPGGKLPVTFYKSVDQVPPFTDYGMAGRTYRYMTDEPLFPFGHGLSYTHFEFSNLRIDPPQIGPESEVSISLNVKNVGERAGDEVVQLYVRYVDSRVTRPVKELEGFKRVTLVPGESRAVSWLLPIRQLAYYDHGRFVIEPGQVEILLGSSSQDIRLRGVLSIA